MYDTLPLNLGYLGTKPLSLRLLLMHLKNAGIVVAIIENNKVIRLDYIIVPLARIQPRRNNNTTSSSNTTNARPNTQPTNINNSNSTVTKNKNKK